MSDSQQFWKEELQRKENNPYLSGKLWKQTWEDMESIKSDKHPKELYTECLSNNPYWRFHTAQAGLTVDDLAMALCKNVGCDLNYCGLIKKSIPSDWKGSSDCSNEYKAFTDCMTRERRNWLWNKHEESMYDYIQNRYEKDKLEKRHKPVFDMKIPEANLTDEDKKEVVKQKMKQSYM